MQESKKRTASQASIETMFSGVLKRAKVEPNRPLVSDAGEDKAKIVLI